MPARQDDTGSIIRRDAKMGLITTVSPLFLTYFMMNWGEVSQTPSNVKCVSCGGAMMSVEPVRDKKGAVFEGIVCHSCKTLLWNRKR